MDHRPRLVSSRAIRIGFAYRRDRLGAGLAQQASELGIHHLRPPSPALGTRRQARDRQATCEALRATNGATPFGA
jgi:hypothetical protein